VRFNPHLYQDECATFLEDNLLAGLLLFMGAGKTAIVLKAIHDFMFSSFDTRTTIVVAPKNVALVTWPNELRKWEQFRSITYSVLHGADKDISLRQKRDLYIINYDGLKWLAMQYYDKALRYNLPKFDAMVIDESTYVKNKSSQRSRLIKMLFGDVRRKIILTGTPSPNGFLDLYGQMDIIAPGVLARTQTSYRDAYFIPPNGSAPGGKWKLRSGVKEIIAGKMAPYVKVIKESDVLDREKAHHNTVLCAFSDAEAMQYKKLEDEFFLQLDTGEGIEVFNAASLAMKLRQFCQGFVYNPETGYAHPVNKVKALALKELVETLDGKPVLCAIQFKHEVDMLRKLFGYRVPALYSGTTTKETADIIGAWNRGEHKLLLAHPASGGIGLNLQEGGSTMCWFSQTWDLQHYLQFNARIDRQGQKEVVMMHHLIIKDTIEERIVEARIAKDGEQQSLIDLLRGYRRNGSMA